MGDRRDGLDGVEDVLCDNVDAGNKIGCMLYALDPYDMIERETAGCDGMFEEDLEEELWTAITTS